MYPHGRNSAGRPAARRRASGGFSLIEIMIVVAVVGLLAGLAAVSTVKARRMARLKQAEVDLAILTAAVEQLAWDTGRWPGGILRNVTQSAELWVLTGASAGLLSADNRFPNWKGPYLAKVPKDPWGNDYFFDPDYRIDGVMRVVVGSFGPNGEGRNRYDSDDAYIVIK